MAKSQEDIENPYKKLIQIYAEIKSVLDEIQELVSEESRETELTKTMIPEL